MIGLRDLKRAGNDILKSLYPSRKIYGVGTSEGMAMPCFFTEIVPYSFSYQTKNFAKQSAGYKITVFQSVPDEDEQLQMVDEIREAFGMKLAAGDRKLNIADFAFEYIGEHHDLLQITVTFEWYENMRKPESGTMMEEVSLSMVQKGDR